MFDNFDELVSQADDEFADLDAVEYLDCKLVAQRLLDGGEKHKATELANLLWERWETDLPPDWNPNFLENQDDEEAPRPSLLFRSDGKPLLYPGSIHWLFGKPESGKTWIALYATAEALAKGRRPAFIDFEMNRGTIGDRMWKLGGDGRFLYYNPTSSLDDQEWDDFAQGLARRRTDLVVIDGVTEAMALEGWDPNSNTDVAKFGRRIQAFARSGAAVVVIDHVTKGARSGADALLGAQQKMATADVLLETKMVKRPSRTRSGRVLIYLRKDRLSHLWDLCTAGDLLAVVEITPSDDRVHVELKEPPAGGPAARSGDASNLAAYMERVSEWVEAHDDGKAKPPSRNQIEKGIGGKQKYVREAIDRLVEGGYLEEQRDGNARRYRFVKPYREGGDE